jgi:hypothetical protein
MNDLKRMEISLELTRPRCAILPVAISLSCTNRGGCSDEQGFCNSRRENPVFRRMLHADA